MAVAPVPFRTKLVDLKTALVEYEWVKWLTTLQQGVNAILTGLVTVAQGTAQAIGDAGHRLLGIWATTLDVLTSITGPLTDRGGQVYNVKAYGTGNNSAAIQAAIDAAPSSGGTVLIPDGAYTVGTQIDVNKAVTLQLGNVTLTGPSSGWMFEVTANEAAIVAAGKATLIATNGCAGLIHNNQAMRTKYHRINMQPNGAANATMFFHDGGWYLSVEDLWIDSVSMAFPSTSWGVEIKSTGTGVPGPTGSYGGAYISTYKNVEAYRLWIHAVDGGIGQKVTTMTFTGFWAQSVRIDSGLAFTFLQPVVQNYSGNPLWKFTDVAGVTMIGGDYEGTGTIYEFNGTCQQIISIGNSAGGFSGTYYTGQPGQSSMLFDDIVGEPGSSLVFGPTARTRYQWVNYATRHSVGMNYDGNVFGLSINCVPLSPTMADLIDITASGMAVYGNVSQQFIVDVFSPGANPRTAARLFSADAQGVHILGGATLLSGSSANPNGSASGSPGDLYLCTVGGATPIWVKASGTATTTGWVTLAVVP